MWKFPPVIALWIPAKIEPLRNIIILLQTMYVILKFLWGYIAHSNLFNHIILLLIYLNIFSWARFRRRYCINLVNNANSVFNIIIISVL